MVDANIHVYGSATDEGPLARPRVAGRDGDLRAGGGDSLGGGSPEYRIVFANAGQLVKGDIVRIGGTGVGTVKAIRLTDDNRAEVRVTVSDDYAPLHEGTTAVIRQQGLVGVASRYVDLSPGPNSSPALDDGAAISDEQATAIVDIDQLFNTLDPETRDGLADVIHGSASWYDGREARANRSAELLPPALTALTARRERAHERLQGVRAAAGRDRRRDERAGRAARRADRPRRQRARRPPPR